MTSDKMADDDSKSACRHDNKTSSSDVSWPFTSVRFIAPVAALVAFNLVVIVGNSLVIAAVFTYRNLRTVTNTFIVSLAVADLLLGAVVLPFSSVNEVLGWWPFGRVWCSAWLAIDVWVCTASILNLCAISLDRYLAISRPFRYPLLMSPTRAKVAVAVVWTLALAICLPPLLGWRDSDVATTKQPYNVTSIEYNSPTSSITGSKSLIQSLTINNKQWTAVKRHSDAYRCQSSVETNALNIVKRSTTNSVITPKSSYSPQLSPSIFRRVTNAADNKRRSEFVGNFATPSAVDVATKSRIVGRGARDAECKEKSGETDGWNFVSNLPIDALTTIASFNACQAASTAPRQLCMLTSEPGYIIYSACGSFWIPMLVMVFFYLKIYRTAVKATTALNSGVLTKKTGRIASNSEGAAVNLRVHRGGAGGRARTVGGYWTSTPNRLGTGCKSSSHKTRRQQRNDADDNSDSDSDRKLRIHGTSTSVGNRSRRPSRERNISHDRALISGSGADPADASCRHPATNRSTGCCRWSTTALRSNRNSTGATDASHRRTCSATAANVDTASRRRRFVARLSNDSDDVVSAAPMPEEGLDSLVQSTVTPMFEQCSASARRSRGDGGNVELVDASHAQAGRRFVQIRTQLRRLNREKKAAKTVGVIVGCFVLCWAPFFTVYVLGVFCAGCTPQVAFAVFFWLGYCNSAINPFVYALCSKDFRFAFRRLLRCGGGTRHNPTIAALVSRLRSPAPRTGSQSANAAANAVATRRFCCQPSSTRNNRMTTRC